MNEFAYQRPASLQDALAALAAVEDARPLAGGQSLLPAMKLGLAAPAGLVDLSGIAEMRGIAASAAGLRIGAMVSHAQVAASPEVRRAIPALAALADGIGDPAVRARGTLGGSLANNDPAACYPAALLALGATVYTDRRSISADAFLTGLYETALEPGELLAAVEFPVPERAAYQKFLQPASRFALVGVFVAKTRGGARVAVTGAAACAFRSAELEAALDADWSSASCDRASVPHAGLNSDLHASAGYRAHLIRVLARRAVERVG